MPAHVAIVRSVARTLPGSTRVMVRCRQERCTIAGGKILRFAFTAGRHMGVTGSRPGMVDRVRGRFGRVGWAI